MKAFPKRGFHNPESKEYVALNLDRLQAWIDAGRIDATQPITMHHLKKSNIVHTIHDGVRLLARGSSKFSAKIDIEVSQASKPAIEAIERNGGRVVCRYYNKLGLQAILRPERFFQFPKLADPTRRHVREWYSNPEHRGYLAPGVAPIVETWEQRISGTVHEPRKLMPLENPAAEPVAIQS